VKPEWYAIEGGFGRPRIRLDLEQIGHLTLGGGWLGRDFEACEALIFSDRARDGDIRFLRHEVPSLWYEIGVYSDAVSFGRLASRVSSAW
jgi:hypothetical protein